MVEIASHAPLSGVDEWGRGPVLTSRTVAADAAALHALGGRRRLRRHLEDALGTLAALALRAAEDLDDVEPDAALPATIPSRKAA
jgi:hypothetical protein